MNLNFDVSMPAPTQQQIIEERAQCLATFDRLRKKNWQSRVLAVVLAASALAIFLLVRQDGVVENLNYVLGPIATLAALGLMAATADADEGAALLGGILGGIVALALAGLAATMANPDVEDTVGLLIGVLVFFFSTLWTFFYIARVDGPQRTVRRRLAALEELLPENHPDHCIAYLEMVETDEALQSYQFQINTMGRKPVLGDFYAAQLWMSGRPTRLATAAKKTQAMAACAKFAATVYGGQDVAAH